MNIEERKVFHVVWWLLTVVKVVSTGISCLSNPCFHGICIDDINSTYSCYCVDGYTGVQCQTNWDECWSGPCQNGGTCVDGIASYNCSCPDGFIGENCETNYNECESNPCLNNGTCIDMTNGYVCSCVPGFSGQHCELDIAVCNTTGEIRCYNGGQCIEGPGFKFYCKCLPGWTGQNCDNQIDECESNPCQNGGACIDVHADYMCACSFGFTGKSCEVQIEFCDENSCSNNALCVVEDGIRVCYCVPDFHGERCELQYDECLLGPRCMNGGTCIDGVDNFTCSCPPKLTGPLCECLILDDVSYDCEYVSPTPGLTQSVFTTILFEGSTDFMSTISSNNESKGKTVLTTEINSLTSFAMVTTENEFETTTENAMTSAGANIEPVIIDITTDTVVTEEFTKLPTESDNVRTDTTTELSSVTLPLGSTMTLDTTTESVTLPTTKVSVTATMLTDLPAEITSTPRTDSTDKMFTDTPTEHATDLVTPPTFLTTESMEASTEVDTGTHVYTTIQTECTESFCNNHGTCHNSPHGIRCHCVFNYGGRFCDEKIIITSAAFGGNSFIAHKLQNTTSIEIGFNAKTLLSEGQIMHVDIATGVYMQLFISHGLLKFKFSCGYQTMLLSELKTFVDKGYSMRIETRLDLFPNDHHCNATLRLNDTVAMSGGQIANISSLDHNTTLYLGNSPDIEDPEAKPFIGCIKDLTVNGDDREVFGGAIEAGEVSECVSLACLSTPCLNGGSCTERRGNYTCSCANGWTGAHCNQSVCEHNPCQSGGSCVKHPGSGFLCLCPYGKHGIFCEYNVEITRPSLSPISTGISSYLMYPLSPAAMNSDRFDLRLRFQTADMDQISLLAFVGQNGRHDPRSQHLALTFVKGYIMLTWNMGNGPRRIFTSRALSGRRGGHAVRVWRRGRSAGLNVDGRQNVTGNAPASDTKLTLMPYLYIGPDSACNQGHKTLITDFQSEPIIMTSRTSTNLNPTNQNNFFRKLGGHPSEGFRSLPHDLPLHSGWRGCIWEVGGQTVGAGRAIGGRGVGQCAVQQCTARSCHAPRGVCIHSPATYGCICNEGFFGPTCSHSQNPCDRNVTKCRGQCIVTADSVAQCDCPYGKTGRDCDQDLFPTDVLFTGLRSYLLLHPRAVSSISLSMEAEIKPAKARGLVLFVETPHFYTALSLQGGLLEYRWTDRVSGVTSLVRSGVVLSMSQWHSVKAGRYGSRLYVWVDAALSTEAMLAHAYPHTSNNATIYLGGAKDLSTLPFDAMFGPPESYTGCIRNLHVNNILIVLEQQNIQEGQNLGDCDGTPCGGEACGGGVCVIEAGRARCSCSGVGGGSTRCRRHATCSPALCSAPRGHCGAGGCVCASGYTGFYCEHKINITIPQFDGSALMSPWRTVARRAGEQRAPRSRPHYLALNFTTPEPDGLLLWADMDKDYIGMGLENGYLRLVWSLRHNTTLLELSPPSENHKGRVLSRLVPTAGYLADGEWHTLALRVERNNISLVVDTVVSYVEEPGLDAVSQYDDVELYIGGIADASATAKKMFPHKFKGCIDHISTKEKSFISNYTEVYSENIKSCQLFPPT